MQADCLAEPKKVTGASSADQCLFGGPVRCNACFDGQMLVLDRKSTRLNSSHLVISYAVFCLKKKTFLALPNTKPDAYFLWSCPRLADTHSQIFHLVFLVLFRSLWAPWRTLPCVGRVPLHSSR